MAADETREGVAALGYDERERLAFLEEAVTRETPHGDPIWKFYDEKVWRSLQYWKERAIQAESELAQTNAVLKDFS